ncbi:hypothetical protein ACFPRL_04105 [Pseudoclavibacter helvolus]
MLRETSRRSVIELSESRSPGATSPATIIWRRLEAARSARSRVSSAAFTLRTLPAGVHERSRRWLPETPPIHLVTRHLLVYR